MRSPRTLRDEAEQAAFAALDADVAVVAAYGLILPQAILDVPARGCLNVHGSLLPRWRGAAPVQRAIMAGDAVTGVTIMQMEAGLDTGPMLLRHEVPIETKNAAQLTEELAKLGAAMMVDTLARLEGLPPIRNPKRASPTPPRSARPKRGSTGRAPPPTSSATSRASPPSPAPGSKWAANESSCSPPKRSDATGAPGEILDDHDHRLRHGSAPPAAAPARRPLADAARRLPARLRAPAGTILA